MYVYMCIYIYVCIYVCIYVYIYMYMYMYMYIYIYMGGCQNYGPFWGALNIRCRIIIGTQKGTLILTATHIYIYTCICVCVRASIVSGAFLRSVLYVHGYVYISLSVYCICAHPWFSHMHLPTELYMYVCVPCICVWRL